MAASPETTRSDTRLQPDEVVGGRYRIVAFLGEGGMGEVYKAEHTIVGRSVALKVLSSEWVTTDQMRRRFVAEARAASAAGHPNIVEVFDAGVLDDGRPFLVMEFLEGRELTEIVSTDAPLSVERACGIMGAVTQAIAAAHNVGVIHRDLKSENVFVLDRPEGEFVKVLDFGIAYAGEDDQGRMTRPGMVMGTPEYMAPEQGYGAEAAPSFDIYAIGTLLYELLTGSVPFKAENPLETLKHKVREPAPSLATARPGLPPELVELVDACLQTEPEDRPSTAAEINDRLQALLEPRGGPPIASLPEPAPVVAAPKRFDAWGMIVAGVLVGCVAVAGVWIGFSEPDAAADAAVADHEDPPAPPPQLVAVPDEEPSPQQEPPPEPEPAAKAEPVAKSEAPAPPVPAKPRPKPRSEPTPPPGPAPTPTPTPKTAPDDAHCGRMVDRARDHREQGEWTHVLKHTQDRRCWKGRSAERKALRAKAYANLGRYDECIAAGKGLADSATRKVVKLCEAKRAQP